MNRPEHAAPILGPVDPSLLHVMSWNIRRPVPDFLTTADDRWAQRSRDVRALLAREQPTIFAAQEVVPSQVPALRDGLGEGYRLIGQGRNADGSGEACPILYDADRLTLQSWEQRALSAHPHRPGSRSWGALFPRVVVVALFTDRLSGHSLRVINTHFDPVFERSRARSAHYLTQVVRETTHPTILCGDLNAAPHSLPLGILTAGGLTDSWESARRRCTPEWGTLGNYREPKENGKRIDWILGTRDLEVFDAAINSHRGETGWGSDHLPVHVTLRLEKEPHE